MIQDFKHNNRVLPSNCIQIRKISTSTSYTVLPNSNFKSQVLKYTYPLAQLTRTAKVNNLDCTAFRVTKRRIFSGFRSQEWYQVLESQGKQCSAHLLCKLGVRFKDTSKNWCSSTSHRGCRTAFQKLNRDGFKQQSAANALKENKKFHFKLYILKKKIENNTYVNSTIPIKCQCQMQSLSN